MSTNEKRPLVGVIYLARCADGLAAFERFADGYRKHPAGHDHELIVLYKGFYGAETLGGARAVFHDMPHTGIELDDEYYDIGSYLEATRRVSHPYLMFFNTHTEISAPNWLKHPLTHMLREGVGIVGAMGSYESLQNSFSLIQKVIWLCAAKRIPYDSKIHDYYDFLIDLHCKDWAAGQTLSQPGPRHRAANYVSSRMLDAGFRLRWWILTQPGKVFDKYAEFPPFPNPHIRSNGFLTERKHMLRFEPFEIREKLDACIFESGSNSLTSQLRREGFSAMVVGRDGGGWDVPRWPESRTFRLQDQSNLLISDNQSRQFDKMSAAARLTHEQITWGDYIGKPPADFPALGLKFRRFPLTPRSAPSRGRLRRTVERIALAAVLARATPQQRAVTREAVDRPAPRPYSVKISVLIPSKNRLGLLKYAVSSILSQNDASIEIVVSDNASTEDYRGYIESLGDKRIVYHRLQTPVTVTDNWRQALSLCSGDYVLMLGDDDALAPNFTSAVRPYLSLKDGPDLVYLAAYHYGYPGVLAFRPSGYLASVKNSEFLLHSDGPFCLAPSYARELGNAVLQFRYRFGLNAQHFLLKTAFVKQCEKQGGLYQSPYPDTFAGISSLVGAKSVVVLTDPTVIIGISPKSFGAYYFSGRHDEGYNFLNNEEIDADVREDLKGIILPGDRNNTNWLVAAEVARRRIRPALSSSLNAERYRALQIAGVLRDRYQQQAANHDVVEELRRKLTPAERQMFQMLESAVEETNDRAVVAKIFDRINRELEQFVPADVTFLEIGEHENIQDAVGWLERERSRARL